MLRTVLEELPAIGSKSRARPGFEGNRWFSTVTQSYSLSGNRSYFCRFAAASTLARIWSRATRSNSRPSATTALIF